MRKTVEGFKPMGGKHCISNGIRQVLHYYDYPITEEMLLGIGGGLGFMYIQLAQVPMIGGRSKPMVFEEKIGARLGIEMKCKTTKSYEKAYKRAKEMIDHNQPVFIYVDMPYLSYLSLEEDNHFGGHGVVLLGYDEEHFYISDRDHSTYPICTPKGDISEDFHKVPFEEVRLARSSNHRPFPANNKWLEIKVDNRKPIDRSIIIEAVQETCETMLEPPANLLGINGIKKFSKEVLKWSRFEEEKVKLAGITNYFMISKDGGTGGGMFRKMYGQFLLEAANTYDIKAYASLGEAYKKVGEIWEEVGQLLWALYEKGEDKALKEISTITNEIGKQEENILIRLRNIR